MVTFFIEEHEIDIDHLCVNFGSSLLVTNKRRLKMFLCVIFQIFNLTYVTQIIDEKKLYHEIFEFLLNPKILCGARNKDLF